MRRSSVCCCRLGFILPIRFMYNQVQFQCGLRLAPLGRAGLPSLTFLRLLLILPLKVMSTPRFPRLVSLRLAVMTPGCIRCS